jgi:hypothetical protein
MGKPTRWAGFWAGSVFAPQARAWPRCTCRYCVYSRTLCGQCVPKRRIMKKILKRPPKLRGTYTGMASDPILAHPKKLGVTTVELMPVHHYVQDRHLVERGLRNYWAIIRWDSSRRSGLRRNPRTCSRCPRVRGNGENGFTTPVSRSSSTRSAITRPKAITPGPRCRSGASIVSPVIVSPASSYRIRIGGTQTKASGKSAGRSVISRIRR